MTSADPVGRLGHDRPPRVDDHRPPERRLTRGPADLRGRQDVGAVLDGAGPEQDLPVVAARSFGEVGRDREDLGPGQRECPVQLGEAQVVADRQPDPDSIDVGDDRPVAGAHPVRLAVDRAVLHRDVEEVDLPVPGDDRPVGREQHARVERPARVARRLGQRSDQDPGRTPPGDGLERLRPRTGDRSRGRTIAVVGAADTGGTPADATRRAPTARGLGRRARRRECDVRRRRPDRHRAGRGRPRAESVGHAD